MAGDRPRSSGPSVAAAVGGLLVAGGVGYDWYVTGSFLGSTAVGLALVVAGGALLTYYWYVRLVHTERSGD